MDMGPCPHCLNPSLAICLVSMNYAIIWHNFLVLVTKTIWHFSKVTMAMNLSTVSSTWGWYIMVYGIDTTRKRTNFSVMRISLSGWCKHKLTNCDKRKMKTQSSCDNSVIMEQGKLVRCRPAAIARTSRAADAEPHFALRRRFTQCLTCKPEAHKKKYGNQFI